MISQIEGSAPALTRWIRERRGPKESIADPRRALAWFWESERTPEGEEMPVLTILLAGAECPFTCVFCDLWRQTLDTPTPSGAIPAQIRGVLAECGPLPESAAIKLYNASNFFAPRAVPPEDDAAIAELVAPFAKVVVECHPRLVGERCLAFAQRLAGELEVAMGLETIHPEALPRLNKGMTLADFDRAAKTLSTAGLGLRAFVLLGAPFVPPTESVYWTVRSLEHALAAGAAYVSILPLREGNGALDALREVGDFVPPTLAQLEEVLERGLACAAQRSGENRPSGVVAADLWEAGRFAVCPACAEARLRRLATMNRTGVSTPHAICPHCDDSPAG